MIGSALRSADLTWWDADVRAEHEIEIAHRAKARLDRYPFQGEVGRLQKVQCGPGSKSVEILFERLTGHRFELCMEVTSAQIRHLGHIADGGRQFMVLFEKSTYLPYPFLGRVGITT